MIRFGPYRIDIPQRQLLRGEQPLKIENIPLDILLLLIRERDRIVTREEIAEQVWGKGRHVEAADGINTAIRKIRRALDDDADEPGYIQTVIGRGYRFIGVVEDDSVATADAPLPAHPAAHPVAEAGSSAWWLPRWTLPAAAVLVLVLAGWGTFRPATSRAVSSVGNLTRLTDDLGYTGWPDISPDGKMLAYASNRADPVNLDIYLQPVEGTEAIQLTHDAARDTAPVISPKGDRVAFESSREPGGIYTMPLLGGEARLLVKDGARPRYSPDGAWIAYSKLEKAGAGPASRKMQSIFSSWIIPASGGEPKALHPELTAFLPIWAGNDFLILTGSRPGELVDWWVTPRDGSWAKPLGVYAELSADRIPGISGGWQEWTPSYFDQRSIVFSARTREGANLWRLRLAEDWKPNFPPERVSLMSDHVRHASAAADGRIVAEVATRNNDVYELPLDPNRGVVTGALHPLTHAKTSEQFASVSADGTWVAYTSWRHSDPGDLYLLNRHTGVERQLTATPEWESFPRISPDGHTVIYRWFVSRENYEIRRLKIASGTPETICEKCRFMDQTADGKSFLATETDGKQLSVRDFAGGAPTEPVHDESFRFAQASLDHSNRWMAFVAWPSSGTEHRIFAVPFNRAGRLPRQQWVEVASGRSPLWSPNGEWLYYDGAHGSFHCLWAQHFNRSAGRPAGAKVALAHFHGEQRLIEPFPDMDRGLARDRLVFSLSEQTANVWLMR